MRSLISSAESQITFIHVLSNILDVTDTLTWFCLYKTLHNITSFTEPLKTETLIWIIFLTEKNLNSTMNKQKHSNINIYHKFIMSLFTVLLSSIISDHTRLFSLSCSSLCFDIKTLQHLWFVCFSKSQQWFFIFFCKMSKINAAALFLSFRTNRTFMILHSDWRQLVICCFQLDHFYVSVTTWITSCMNCAQTLGWCSSWHDIRALKQ